MKTGIVFKIEGHKAIVLKADGSFVSVDAKKGWKPGETVPLSAASKSRAMPFLAMAACLAIAAVGGFGWDRVYHSPMALISLDVNPSIELSVNRFDRIIAAKALNDEGSQILSEANIQNAAYQEALAGILNAESVSGYLTTDANVVLTVFSADSALQSSLLSELQGVVDARISLYADQITTEYHAVDEATVNGAHGHGVTAGKYLYLQELQELAPETDISELTHHSIEQLKGEIDACKLHHDAGDNRHSHGGNHRQDR